MAHSGSDEDDGDALGYLEERGVLTLLEDAVTGLCEHRPDDPARFLSRWFAGKGGSQEAGAGVQGDEPGLEPNEPEVLTSITVRESLRLLEERVQLALLDANQARWDMARLRIAMQHHHHQQQQQQQQRSQQPQATPLQARTGGGGMGVAEGLEVRAAETGGGEWNSLVTNHFLQVLMERVNALPHANASAEHAVRELATLLARTHRDSDAVHGLEKKLLASEIRERQMATKLVELNRQYKQLQHDVAKLEVVAARREHSAEALQRLHAKLCDVQRLATAQHPAFLLGLVDKQQAEIEEKNGIIQRLRARVDELVEQSQMGSPLCLWIRPKKKDDDDNNGGNSGGSGNGRSADGKESDGGGGGGADDAGAGHSPASNGNGNDHGGERGEGGGHTGQDGRGADENKSGSFALKDGTGGQACSDAHDQGPALCQQPPELSCNVRLDGCAKLHKTTGLASLGLGVGISVRMDLVAWLALVLATFVLARRVVVWVS